MFPRYSAVLMCIVSEEQNFGLGVSEVGNHWSLAEDSNQLSFFSRALYSKIKDVQ